MNNSQSSFGRWVLRGDGFLACALSLAGLVTWRMQAELTSLPGPLLLGAAIGLLPYGIAAIALTRPSVTVSRGALMGTVAFNAAWVLGTIAAALETQPNALGMVLLASHVLLPGAVAAVVARDVIGVVPARVAG